MKLPKLILVDDLLKPVLMAHKRISDIYLKVQDQKLDELDCHGLFVLAVSTLESMMNDIIIYLLNAIPQKLDLKELILTKDQIVNSFVVFDIIEHLSQQEAKAASYKNIEQFIEYFCKITSLNNIFSQDKIDELREIKETRNLLLHNNLKINEFYKAKAGPNIRQGNSNGFLEINIKYLKRAIQCIQYFVNKIHYNLKKKFHKYTKIYLFKSIWDYCFDSPIMQFEDYWELNTKRGEVVAIKKCKYEGGLSSGETSLLNLWRSLFTGDTEYLKKCWFRHLGPSYKEKAIFLIILSERTTLW